MIYKLVLLGLVANVCLANSRDKFALNKEEELKEEKTAPIPYNFEYNSRDENGTTQFRKESSDATGKVQGRYGYKDMYGIERIVEYTADENGYRAEIKTNEPGTENKNPAGVLFNSQPMDLKQKHSETTEEHLQLADNSQKIPSTEDTKFQTTPVLLSNPQPSTGSQYFFFEEQPKSTLSSSKLSPDKETKKYSFFDSKSDKKPETFSSSLGSEEKPALSTLAVQPAFQYAAPQPFHYVGGNIQNQLIPANHFYQQYAPGQNKQLFAQPLPLTNLPQTAHPLFYHYNTQPLAYQNNNPAAFAPTYYSLQEQLSTTH